MQYKPHISVIGAGLAGLTASSKLNPDWEVTLIESQLGPGGRASSSKAIDGIMPQRGATFSYDMVTQKALESAGAQVIQFNQGCYYVRIRGEFHRTGVSDGPRGAVERIAQELAQNQKNISVLRALDECDEYQRLSSATKKMTRALISADVAGVLSEVGTSSFRHDGQTLVGSPNIGVCTIGGFRDLSKALARAGNFISYGTSDNNREVLFRTQLRGIGYDTNEKLFLYLHDKKFSYDSTGELTVFPMATDAVFVGLPVTAVKRLDYFADGKEHGKLSQQLPQHMQRALNMIEPGHVVKISVLLDRPLIEDTPICHITINPNYKSGINCHEVWCLPSPSSVEFPNTPKTGKQIVLLYLAGEQALELRQFLRQERDIQRKLSGSINQAKEKRALSTTLRLEVERFLADELGVAPHSILGTRTSFWGGGQSEPYTYIRPDNLDSSFNPRAQFNEQALPGVWIGGSEFSLRATLVGGALESGERQARNIVDNISSRASSPRLNESYQHTDVGTLDQQLEPGPFTFGT
jgi:hypothetical protein